MKQLANSRAPVLIAAGLSILFSVYLWFFVSQDSGLFVAVWVPSILAFGILMRSK